MEAAVTCPGIVGWEGYTECQSLIAGGIRLYEYLPLFLCDEYQGMRLYVGRRARYDMPITAALGLPCRVEYVAGDPPDGVEAVDARLLPTLAFEQGNLDCGGARLDLGLRRWTDRCVRVDSMADLLVRNVELMGRVVGRMRELLGDVVKGPVGGTLVGDVVVLGRVYEYAYVEGPAIVGPGSSVLPFTYVRPGSALYGNVKVRDEAKNAVMDVFSNKAHGGYLGDAYVGKFVNIGAGTTVSNLKNTLGPVRFRGREVGKMGPVIGDFAKTAISTSIYGGRVVGVMSHVYGTIARDVPPFSICEGDRCSRVARDKVPVLAERDLALHGLPGDGALAEELLHMYDSLIRGASP